MTTFDYRVETALSDGRSLALYFVSPHDPDSLDRLCLYLAALPRASGQPPGTIPDPLDLAQDGLLEGAHYLVAQVEDEVVGAVTLGRDLPAARHGYHVAHVAQVQLDLLPHWHGHEAGQVLVNGLVEWAKAQPDLKRLECDTLSCNAWLVELLGQVGFAVEGRARAGWYARTLEGEMYVDRVSLGLLLDEAISVDMAPAAERAAPEPPIAPDDSIPDVDCSVFFTDLVKQVRAFLPYELREFEARETANEVHMLVEGLPQGVSFAVAFRLASAEFGTPEMIELGLHWRRDPDFNAAQVKDFKEKLEALGEALGKKTLYADLWRMGWGRVARRLPYQSPDEAHAFMLAAQVAGFIQVLLPEVVADG
jgi:RimJ/RimL family protein N-acetyltransferase